MTERRINDEAFMNMKWFIRQTVCRSVSLLWLLTLIISDVRSGEFTNLLFSEPAAPFPTPDAAHRSASADQVFAGWQVFKNDQSYNGIVPYGATMGQPLELREYDLFERLSPTAYPFTPQLIAGAQLWSSDLSPDGRWRDWRTIELRQTGLVPLDAVTFGYYTQPYSESGSGPRVSLEMGGQVIGQPWMKGLGPGYRNEYGWDVTPYRGQEVTIRIREIGRAHV